MIEVEDVFEGAKFWVKFVGLLDNNVSKNPKSPDYFLLKASAVRLSKSGLTTNLVTIVQKKFLHLFKSF